MAKNQPKSLRVMTCNVRQMDGDDGPQSWEFRKTLLAESIQRRRPDLLGTQETFPEQAEFLLQQLPHMDCFGRGRYGDNRDKHNKIFFDRERLSVVECGESWFSQTPHVPGSQDWGIPTPRMVSWGRLHKAAGGDLLILNTHMPYGRNAGQAKREAARIILELVNPF